MPTSSRTLCLYFYRFIEKLELSVLSLRHGVPPCHFSHQREACGNFSTHKRRKSYNTYYRDDVGIVTYIFSYIKQGSPCEGSCRWKRLRGSLWKQSLQLWCVFSLPPSKVFDFWHLPRQMEAHADISAPKQRRGRCPHRPAYSLTITNITI